MKTKTITLTAGLVLSFLAAPAADTVATAVYSKVAKEYKRAKAKDGSLQPEYYVMTNGGLIAGTASDSTVEKVTYLQVAEISRRLLAEQQYHLAQTKEQAKLLLVLNWGTTLAPNGVNKEMNVATARAAIAAIQEHSVTANDPLVTRHVYENQDISKNAASGFNRNPIWANNEEMAVFTDAGAIENSYVQSLADDSVRDRLNQANARVLGYMDDLADSNDIRRHAGGGDRYNDLIADVEESRYYIVVSAYDLRQLERNQKKKLLWQTRVSVRSPGNSFNDSYLAMLKSASAYFGRNSGKLVRGEEAKGTVELGELKYLGPTGGQTAEPANADESGEEDAGLSEGEEAEGETEESGEEGFQSLSPPLQK